MFEIQKFFIQRSTCFVYPEVKVKNSVQKLATQKMLYKYQEIILNWFDNINLLRNRNIKTFW